jgi:hypothetical protein
LFCGAFVATAFAQLRIRPDLEDREYKVNIVSQFGVPVTIGLFGRKKDATSRLAYDGVQPDEVLWRLDGGERVVVVWDRKGRLMFASELLVDRSGTLEIPGFAAHFEGGGRDGERGGAMYDHGIPRLSIQ